MAARASLIDEETASPLNFIGCWSTQRGQPREQVRISQTLCDVLRNAIKVRVRPLITWHLAVRQISLRIAQPGDQPIRIHLAPDFGQLRPNIAADQAGRTSPCDRERMTGRAEHLPKPKLTLIGRVGFAAG